MTPATKKPKMSHTCERIGEIVRDLADQTRLSKWTELCEDVKVVDNGLAVALMAGRPELVKIAKGRPLTSEECQHLYHLVGTLLETNQLLQQHASLTSQLVENWMGHFKGMNKAAKEIQSFANFETIYDEDDDSNE